jgi:hypothetical protein
VAQDVGPEFKPQYHKKKKKKRQAGKYHLPDPQIIKEMSFVSIIELLENSEKYKEK